MYDQNMMSPHLGRQAVWGSWRSGEEATVPGGEASEACAGVGRRCVTNEPCLVWHDARAYLFPIGGGREGRVYRRSTRRR